jgi:signal transduction histidine kinase
LPAELETAQRHLACLYRISKVLANYEGASISLPLVFTQATEALPLDLLVLLEGNESPQPWVEKSVSIGPDRVTAAVASAKKNLESYTEQDPVWEGTRAEEADGAIALPLAVDRRVLGLLYVETARELDELDLAFVSALANQLAVAIDRHHAWDIAQEAIRSRDNILAIVSHDLSNMLSTILLATELAIEVVPPVERRRFSQKSFSMIRRSAERMNHLIHDLLDTASIDAKHITIDCTWQAVHPLISEVVELFQLQVDSKEIVLTEEIPAELLPVFVDRYRVLQVFSNLVGNAIKFTPSRGRILIRAVSLVDEILFSVTDTGPGISAAEQPHIFDRFWQARRTAKLGTGLGLSIANGIVAALGGRIWVESRNGAGTTFFFTLPTATRELARSEHLGPRQSQRGGPS